LVVGRFSFAVRHECLRNEVCQRLSTNDYRRTKGYNSRVNPPVPPKPGDNKHQHRHSIYAAEATGLLVIAVLLLILTIIRYWRYIPWNAR
jgi:hypothetical protein